ncbi:hypothetical protein FE251_09530 [Georgenia wutianyii]|uniref:Uncharacterized protein n=2 Tax=Georgenia wutianyii TaxID=2585135 RepID=A0ABX5VUD9_9MICO|nr:hypothetical protein FE251_09530 [Georgenia wutianyii]
MSDHGTMHGRSPAVWDDFVGAATAFLSSVARREGQTTYTELNRELTERTGRPGFNFDSQAERAAMGYLLGRVVEHTRPESGCMLSALVIYLGGNDPGSGFYALAKQLGLLSISASADERLTFWAAQVKGLHRHYAAVEPRS